MILFHTPPRLPLLDDGVILNMRMPVFFFISGLLYASDRYDGHFVDYARRRCRQILVPYVVFTLLFYALWLAVGRRMVGPEEMAIPWWQPLVELVTGDPHTVVAPFWFITSLLTMQLIYYWMYRFVPRAWLLPLAFAMSLGSRLLPGIGFWNLSNAMLFMPFYVAGNVFKVPVLGTRLDTARRWLPLALLAALSIAAMVWALLSLEEHSVEFAAVRVASGLALLPAFFGVAQWLARLSPSLFRGGSGRGPVETVVLCGTVYLAMQNYAIGFVKIIIVKCGGEHLFTTMPAIKLLIAFTVMAAIYPVAALILRRAPWLAGQIHPRDAAPNP